MTRLIYPFLQSFDASGKPLVGGKAHTYIPGGTVRTKTYADAAKTVPARNPLILDGSGKVKAFGPTGTEFVKIVCNSYADVEQWTNEGERHLPRAAPTATLNKFKAYNDNGDVLAGGKVYTYEPGTSKEYTTYSDAALSIANDNPVILDSNGEADIFCADSDTPKLVLKDSNDRLMWTGRFLQSPIDVYRFGGITPRGQSRHLQALNFLDSDIQGTNLYRSVWGDSNFIYVAADASGLMSYSIAVSGVLTHIDTDKQGLNPYFDVYGDGNFLYAAADDSGLMSYSVDGAGNLTHIDTDLTGQNYFYAICGDGTYLFVIGDLGISSYSVDGSGVLSYISTIIEPGLAGGDTIWSGGTYVYAGHSSRGIASYSIDGSGNLTLVSSDTTGQTGINHYEGIWGDGSFIYAVIYQDGLHSYSVDGSGNLTHIDADNQGGYYNDITSDGAYLYVSCGNDGMRVYSADGAGILTHLDGDDQGGWYMASWANSSFILCTESGLGLLSYKYT